MQSLERSARCTQLTLLQLHLHVQAPASAPHTHTHTHTHTHRHTHRRIRRNKLVQMTKSVQSKAAERLMGGAQPSKGHAGDGRAFTGVVTLDGRGAEAPQIMRNFLQSVVNYFYFFRESTLSPWTQSAIIQQLRCRKGAPRHRIRRVRHC